MALILQMAVAFLDMYRLHMKGKCFANLEQEWTWRIEDYFTSDSVAADEAPLTMRGERRRLWDKVTLAATAVGPTLDNQEWRIIVSTFCCIVYDLIMETVKNYKLEPTAADIDAPSTS